MEKQNAKNHFRFVPGFHLLTSLCILVAMFFATIIITGQKVSPQSVYPFVVAVCLGLMFYYIRRFATRNQDRIIRAEENFRSFRLTGKPLDERLSSSQIVGLRFADDEEYAALSEKVLRENMRQSDIKKAVRKWRADHHRV